MRYAVLSSSHHPQSRSRRLARLAHACLSARGANATFIDLAARTLPLCDGSGCYGDPEVQRLRQDLDNIDGFIIATPIYNYGANAVLKNAIELTGRGIWLERVVGFACAAGGSGSYMSIMPIVNSLMLDFRTVVVPRFVYAREEDFVDQDPAAPSGAPNSAASGDSEAARAAEVARTRRAVVDAIADRVDSLAADVIRFATALRNPSSEAGTESMRRARKASTEAD